MQIHNRPFPLALVKTLHYGDRNLILSEKTAYLVKITSAHSQLRDYFIGLPIHFLIGLLCYLAFNPVVRLVS